jgi:hypothetical protein
LPRLLEIAKVTRLIPTSALALAVSAGWALPAHASQASDAAI